MVLVKQKVMELDVRGLWPHHLPNVAATEDRLRAVEQHVGHPLDPSYRAFLGYADGWEGFYQTVDLFGTADLLGSLRISHALSLLEAMDESVIQQSGFSRKELSPIAVTLVDRDLFVMSRPFSSSPGVVLWFAGELIDRFPNFDEYFLAMADHNRLEAQNLERDRQKKTQ